MTIRKLNITSDYWSGVGKRTMSGTPCIAGTRIPVIFVLQNFWSGATVHDLMEEYEIDGDTLLVLELLSMEITKGKSYCQGWDDE